MELLRHVKNNEKTGTKSSNAGKLHNPFEPLSPELGGLGVGAAEPEQVIELVP